VALCGGVSNCCLSGEKYTIIDHRFIVSMELKNEKWENWKRFWLTLERKGERRSDSEKVEAVE